MEKMVNDRDRQ